LTSKTGGCLSQNNGVVVIVIFGAGEDQHAIGQTVHGNVIIFLLHAN
jgi:hypothetical protein